jgi:hypothetical protein
LQKAFGDKHFSLDGVQVFVTKHSKNGKTRYFLRSVTKEVSEEF